MAVLTRDEKLIEQLKAVLAEQQADLQASGVCELSLVGSRARGAARPASDVDLLMDLTPDATFGLFDLVAFKDALRDALGVEIDIIFKSRLRPYVAERLTRDTVPLL